MKELKVKVPRELESEVKSWGVDVQPLFLEFLRQEFNKLRRFEKAVRESQDEMQLKKLADEMDEGILRILANKARSKSELTEKQIKELGEELKERVAKRHEL